MVYIGHIKIRIFIGTFYVLRLGGETGKVLLLLVGVKLLQRLLGKPTNPALQRFRTLGKSSYEAACKQSWLELAHQDKPESTNLFLSCSLLGTTNDPFNLCT